MYSFSEPEIKLKPRRVYRQTDWEVSNRLPERNARVYPDARSIFHMAPSHQQS